MIPRAFLHAALAAAAAGCIAGPIGTLPAGSSATAATDRPAAMIAEPSGAREPELAGPQDPAAAAGRIDFATRVRPILEAGCRPCHFAGGRMYGTLPFDRPATVRALGTQLFTRIKSEADRAVLRAFLDDARPAEAGVMSP